MSEIKTGEPLSEQEVEAIGSALRALPDGLGERVIAGLACAAALGFRITTCNEGDTPIPGHFIKQDTGESKERYKKNVLSNVAERLGIEEPDSQAAQAAVRSGLVWTDLLASELSYATRNMAR